MILFFFKMRKSYIWKLSLVLGNYQLPVRFYFQNIEKFGQFIRSNWTTLYSYIFVSEKKKILSWIYEFISRKWYMFFINMSKLSFNGSVWVFYLERRKEEGLGAAVTPCGLYKFIKIYNVIPLKNDKIITRISLCQFNLVS